MRVAVEECDYGYTEYAQSEGGRHETEHHRLQKGNGRVAGHGK